MILDLFLIKLNTSKMVFFCMMMMSTLTSFSINNWMSMWIMMEITLFTFIPLMSKNKINDQSMKYFIIQSTSTYILIFSVVWNSLNETSISSLMTMISLLIKIGMAPFHIWKPEIMSKLAWKECFLLTSLIKIPPMILMNKLVKLNMMILPMILSILAGSLGGINQMNLKKMMAYSSIFNLTWMTSSFLVSKKIMLTFLIIYFTLNMKAMFFFNKNNLIYKNQMMNLPLKLKITMNLNMLSISGLPPLTGFYPKWIILNELVKSSILLPGMMVITSITSIFMYIQMNTFTLSNAMVKKKNSNLMLSLNFSIFNLIILPMIFIVWKY